MDRPDLQPLTEALRDLLSPHLARSEPLRRVVRELGKVLIAEADAAQSSSTPPAASEHSVNRTDAAPDERPQTTAASSPRPSQIVGPRVVQPTPNAEVELRLGDTGVPVRVFGRPDELERARASANQPGPTPEPAIVAPDLAVVEQRCRLKGEACRVYVQRRAAAEGSPQEQTWVARVDELVERARQLPNCFLWMVFRSKTQPSDDDLAEIARWYDALATAAALMRRVDEDRLARRADAEAAMQLLAHADAGLRVVLDSRTWLTKPDTDQDEVHDWLRWETGAREIRVKRYMRLDDPPEPGSIEQLDADLAHMVGELDARQRQAAATGKLLNTLRYHADRLAQGDADNAPHDWKRIDECARDLAALGLDPEEDAVASRLEALAESHEEAPEAFPFAARALDAVRLAAAESEEPLADDQRRHWSDRVRRVRTLLRGQRVVMIGGERRVDAIQRMTEAFELGEVEWIELTEHGSGASMLAPIERPETALVLVLIRLAGHLHVDEARRFAKRAGKPVVLLPAGYNPERMALGILSQASEQLSNTRVAG